MEVLNVRRLVAVDIALHGQRFIIAEFLLAVIFSPVIGLLVLPVDAILGWFVSLFAVNYLCLLIYALDITRKGTAEKEAEPILSDRNKLISITWRQFIVFIPFSMAMLSIIQELNR